MKIAIQEQCLVGRTYQDRYRLAKDSGVDAVELRAEDVEHHIYEIAEVLSDLNLPVSGLFMGRLEGFLSPHRYEREKALDTLRQALASASDFHAPNVILVPHWGKLALPDLSPFHTPHELAHEVFVWFLRTAYDLADALGVVLHLQARNFYETDYLRTLAYGATLCGAIKNHPAVRLAPNWFDMGMEETDPVQALRDHHALIGYVTLTPRSGRLPLNPAEVEELITPLREANYQGWVTLATRHPILPTPAELAESIRLLRSALNA